VLVAAVRDPLLAVFFDHVDAGGGRALRDAVDAERRQDTETARAVAAIFHQLDDLGRLVRLVRRQGGGFPELVRHADLRAVRRGDDGRLAVLAHGAVHGAGVAHGLLDHLSRPAGSRLRGRRRRRRRRRHDVGRIGDRNGVARGRRRCGRRDRPWGGSQPRGHQTPGSGLTFRHDLNFAADNHCRGRV